MLPNSKESLEANDKLLASTFLGEGATFKGELTVDGTLCIDHKFEGKISSDTLIVNETGVIEGNILAGTVVCKGRVEGNITASQKVEMHPKSFVIDDVKSPSLIIESGATLEGTCNMPGKRVVK